MGKVTADVVYRACVPDGYIQSGSFKDVYKACVRELKGFVKDEHVKGRTNFEVSYIDYGVDICEECSPGRFKGEFIKKRRVVAVFVYCLENGKMLVVPDYTFCDELL